MWLNHWHRLVVRSIFGITSAAVLVSCVSLSPATPTLEPALKDQSLLTDTPCAAPCWYGLELGKTTKVEALATAQTLSFINSTVFPEIAEYYGYWDGSKDVNVPGTRVLLRCKQQDQTCSSLLFVNDTLKEILLAPNYELTLGEVVAHLGEPDYFRFFPTSIHGHNCAVSLFWKQWGIRVTYLNVRTTQIRCDAVQKDKRLDKNLLVQRIAYMLPENFAIASAPEPGQDFPWAGFIEP